jgi:hypothetical protein
MMFNQKLVCSIRVDGKIMREHGDTIYLPFGSDFSIFLKNLNTVKAQVSIKIDGDDILDGNNLIIDPGKSLDLERWLVGGMKTGPTLRFIEKSDEIAESKEETGMDGIVEVSYQFEKVWPTLQFYDYPTTLYRTYTPPNVYGGFTNMSNFKVGGSVGSTLDGSVTTSASVGANVANQALYSSEVTSEVYDSGEVYCSASILNEEGMTVKGEEVNQKFEYAHIGTLDGVKHVMCFQLKGDVNNEKVATAITVKSKVNCSKCNKSQSTKNRFCVQCGNNMKY